MCFFVPFGAASWRYGTGSLDLLRMGTETFAQLPAFPGRSINEEPAVRRIITLLAGLLTTIVLFIYLAGRTSWLERFVAGERVWVGDCVMRVLPGYRITYPGDWPIPPEVPVIALSASAGLLVGLILWVTWAKSY
jgi:hypothetical protein